MVPHEREYVKGFYQSWESELVELNPDRQCCVELYDFHTQHYLDKHGHDMTNIEQCLWISMWHDYEYIGLIAAERETGLWYAHLNCCIYEFAERHSIYRKHADSLVRKGFATFATPGQGRKNCYVFSWSLDTSKPLAWRRSRGRKIKPKVRYKVMCRDGFKCVICGRDPSHGIMLHVDHIVPVTLGGYDTEDNLRVLCCECNLGKGASYAG